MRIGISPVKMVTVTLPLLLIVCRCSSSPRYSGNESSGDTSKSANVQSSQQGRFSFYQRGNASFYGKNFHGKKTACGEIYNMHDLTAAHRKLPFNTVVRVTNRKNNKSVVVRINDRGPFIRGRVIDLSYEAARRIGMIQDGVVPVRIEIRK